MILDPTKSLSHETTFPTLFIAMIVNSYCTEYIPSIQVAVTLRNTTADTTYSKSIELITREVPNQNHNRITYPNPMIYQFVLQT